MQSNRASYTAQGAAAARAAFSQAADPALRNPDDLAIQLIGPAFRAAVSLPGLRQLAQFFYDRKVPGILVLHLVRTKEFDRVLLDEVRQGARQVVLLGAGLDTRAYRHRAALTGVPFFEVDHPATQAFKLERLRAASVSTPENLRHVPVDFERDDLRAQLSAAGFTWGLPTLFLWEGVSPYLTPAAIDQTLAIIASSGAGSSVVFDYLYADAIAEPERYPDGVANFQWVQEHGEPYILGLDPATLSDWLSARGFMLVSDKGPEALVREHATGADGQTAGPCLSFFSICHARVA